MAEQCKECGCQCRSCDQGTLHLHVEIENLKQRLVERDRHIVTMETNFLSEADKFPDGEYAALTEELLTWQEKYSRLYESYKRVQKVNQGLEDKLLKVVDKFESEKGALTRDVASLTQRLVDARFNVNRYQEENERYRNDLNLAIQFLQCKPANFVSQKFEQLPTELQQKVRTYMSSKRRPSECNGLPPKVERRTIKVPIPTFPPTAMVYSVNKAPNEKDLSDEEKEIGEGKPPVDIVSAAILAKILEERERERLQIKHCSSCSCPSLLLKVDVSTQTENQIPMSNSPSSPAIMNLRYSSSLLGSGEASQVLVSLADDPSSLVIPMSQSSSAKQSPRNSITSNAYSTKSEEEGMDSKKLSCLNNINRSFEASIWDDWSINLSDTQKLPHGETVSQGSDTAQSFSRKDVNMPKVSVNNSPGICRVNSTVMPSSAASSLVSSWSRIETPASETLTNKKFKVKGKVVNNQDNMLSPLLVKAQESTKSNDANSGCDVNTLPKDGGKSDLNFSKFQHNSSSKLNQTRLLPETKLYASGDTVEVHPMDSLMYSVECEKRLGPIPTKNSSQVPNSSSPPSTDRKERDSRPSGPRPCSLRFQAGSNNILLDNAQSYEPILYTSRQANANIAVTPPKSNDALVHTAGTRLDTTSSLDDLLGPAIAPEPAGSNQKLLQRALSNRTETGV